jgi:hypothetical protein
MHANIHIHDLLDLDGEVYTIFLVGNDVGPCMKLLFQLMTSQSS